ncbi:DUF6950 family protein [Sphingomonas sp. DC2300-3]
MVRRRDAAQKTLDVWSKRPLRMGTSDCVRMGASHLRLLGHQVKLPASGSYRTVNSAVKALNARGFDSVEAAIDAMGMKRIAPAAAIVADLLMLPGVDRLGGLAICLGNGRVVAYHEEVATAAVLQPLEYVTAWSVL